MITCQNCGSRVHAAALYVLASPRTLQVSQTLGTTHATHLTVGTTWDASQTCTLKTTRRAGLSPVAAALQVFDHASGWWMRHRGHSLAKHHPYRGHQDPLGRTHQNNQLLAEL